MLEKYNNAFVEVFGVEESELNETFVFGEVLGWDSVGHMRLISALEEAFDIMIDMDDMIDFGSYEGGKEIMKKYDIEL